MYETKPQKLINPHSELEILTQIPLKLIEQIKLNKDMEALNNRTIKIDLINILINITSTQNAINVQVHTEHLTK